ncbi:hypothetical protein [Rubinisphaera brasiliensis]|uniref:Uncharacterized protein n=1 Tax=Rubinisphaera brasiliensis (strain ATCC 49424 / DSM 5305 / JCM 21570 / IAM 15109 / NBRC 103401 / IFAM 1448) TaxID=756272 RepID=F0SJ73_RUBBR|nr:hypothetical protein [Rubinisphaera brasiliensis]ADY58615.1 hypothetical protein Plabr_0994 [Rubinisphaera brasiliensis DSM 5305]
MGINLAPHIYEQSTKADAVKSLTKELWMEIPDRRGIVSLHREVERLVAESGIQDGFVLVNPSHPLDAHFGLG